MTVDDPAPNSGAVLEKLFAVAHGHAQAGRLAQAVAGYQKILQRRPESFEAHYYLGNLLLIEGRHDEAAAQYTQALALRPDLAEAHNNLGGILQRQGKLDQAITHFQQAIALKPTLAEAHNNLGGALKIQGQLDAAAAQFERALALRPNLAEAHNNLGGILQTQGMLERAASHYQQALTLRPDLAEPYKNLANTLVQQGKFAEAATRFQQAIALKPDYAEAHHDRADLKTYRPGDPDLAILESLAAAADRLPAGKMVYIHFALGKALEDIGDYRRAFEHFRQGNTLKRREVPYDEAASRREFLSIADTFDPAALERFREMGDPSPTPIFVVGMPRSGSTLVEQILASHPQVHAAGELPNLSRLVQAAAAVGSPATDETGSAAGSRPLGPAETHAERLQGIGRAYLASLPPLADRKTRVVDKAPGNFFNVGLIRLIVPNARIIHTTRSPIDTCVSCFTRLFSDGQDFSYDLAELGRYYRRYEELMAHWRSVLPPGAMLDVAYEEVVGDLETQARRLIEFCGLPWDAACLAFHRTNRPVFTASNVQVRRPLYRTSLDRWRRFEADLEPLLTELGGLAAR